MFLKCLLGGALIFNYVFDITLMHVDQSISLRDSSEALLEKNKCCFVQESKVLNAELVLQACKEGILCAIVCNLLFCSTTYVLVS
jgi:hypothetical protein